jgi:hypothetical protein
VPLRLAISPDKSALTRDIPGLVDACVGMNGSDSKSVIDTSDSRSSAQVAIEDDEPSRRCDALEHCLDVQIFKGSEPEEMALIVRQACGYAASPQLG